MWFDNVSILGLAHVDAPHRVPTEALEDRLHPTLSRLGLPKDLLGSVTGVRARRFWDPGTKPSTKAAEAARLAIQRSGIDAARLGVLINTSVCKDFIEPSVASMVHGSLGLPANCLNFDISSACLGFINGMEVVGSIIERGDADYGIVVDAESSRHVVEKTLERLSSPDCTLDTLKSQIATLTLGSGAAAMVLGRAQNHPGKPMFRGGLTLAATEFNHLCRGHEHEMITDAPTLLKEGVALAKRTWKSAEEKLGWSNESVDLFALHQVGQAHTSTLAKEVGFDESRAHLIFQEFGNVGPASVPMVLSKAVAEDLCQSGDRVLLGGIGSGLNCTVAGVQW